MNSLSIIEIVLINISEYLTLIRTFSIYTCLLLRISSFFAYFIEFLFSQIFLWTIIKNKGSFTFIIFKLILYTLTFIRFFCLHYIIFYHCGQSNTTSYLSLLCILHYLFFLINLILILLKFIFFQNTITDIIINSKINEWLWTLILIICWISFTHW